MTTPLFKKILPRILDEISKAKFEIKAAIGWFTNHHLFDALCDKIKQGVTVELIILNDYINNRNDGLDFQYFIDIGGNFYFGDDDHPMHNKTCIIDRKVLINGSYNWTYYAESRNEENTIIHENNEALVREFIENFDRMRDQLPKIEKVIKNRLAGIHHLFDTHNYLGQDYLFLAIDKNDPSIVKKAFKLLPNNFGIQKMAVEFNLSDKRITTATIIEEIKDDRITVLIPVKTQIPANGRQRFTTTEDNQETCNITIKYGEKEEASKNKLIGEFKMSGIPKMKQGEPKLITKWTIDLFGILTITEIIEGVENDVTKSYDINHLLKKVEE